MRRTVASLVLVMAAACGGDGDDPAPVATTTPDTSGVTTTALPASSRFSRAPVSEPPARGQATLVDVRVGKHDTFTRVVFEFDTLPGFAVAPAEPPFTQDGSGNEVRVDGEGFLTVRLESARAHNDVGKPTTNNARIEGPGGGSITEVVPTGDFEGVVNFVIGMTGDHAFAVDTLASRHLIVIDIETP